MQPVSAMELAETAEMPLHTLGILILEPPEDRRATPHDRQKRSTVPRMTCWIRLLLSSLAGAALLVSATAYAQPTARCHATVSVALGADGSLTLSPTLVDDGSSDGSGRPVSFSVSPNTFGCADIASSPHTVTLTATSSGSSDTCTSEVTITLPPPEITCMNVVANVDGSGNTSIFPTDPVGSVTQACGATVMFAANQTMFTCADVGGNVIVVTATSDGGMDTCNATLTVQDLLAPVLTCETTVTLPDSTETLVSATLSTPTSSDNCSSASVTNDAPAAGYPLGTTAVTWTATDLSGNTATCVTNVVRDCCAADMGVPDMGAPDMGAPDMGAPDTDQGVSDAGATDMSTPTDDMGADVLDQDVADGGDASDASDDQGASGDQAGGADQGSVTPDAGTGGLMGGSSCAVSPRDEGAPKGLGLLVALGLVARRFRRRRGA